MTSQLFFLTRNVIVTFAKGSKLVTLEPSFIFAILFLDLVPLLMNVGVDGKLSSYKTLQFIPELHFPFIWKVRRGFRIT